MTSPLLALELVSDPLVLFLSGLALLILFIWYFATESDRRKRNIGTILILGLCSICLLALIPPSKTLKGGIDIVGGSAFTLRVQPNIDPTTGEVIPLSPTSLDQAVETIEKRLNGGGISDMLIAKSGTDTIILQMPGMDPESAAEVRETLQKVAKLELKEVSNKSRQLAELVYNGEEVVPGFSAYKYEGETRTGEPYTEYLLLDNRPAVDGKDVADAWPQTQGADHQVGIKLTGEGGEKMGNLTQNMELGSDRIAVLLDNEVITAPVVQDRLRSNFVIMGQRNFDEASKLASQLLNPMENALDIEEERTVSPSLGIAVVKQGTTSALVGLALTAVFILIYYRMAGIVALFALVTNAILIFGAMAMFGFTFTLPGIAGIILTIGMAVDANVLIYERLREELENGKSLANAIDTAYEKAFSAIFDSNITSLLSAGVLLSMASGTVKGFAVTLTVGLLASMFSAILVTRVFFRWATDTGMLKKLSLLNLFKKTNFDFLGKRKTAFIISMVLGITAISGFAIKRTNALGVDFTGGTIISFQFQPDQDGIRQTDAENALKDLNTKARPMVQEEKVPGSGELLTIRVDTEDVVKVEETLRAAFPVLGERIPNPSSAGDTKWAIDASKESVSATAGAAFLTNSGIALLVGLIAISIYISIRFEFSFALGAFVAVVHDVIIAVGLIILMGGELSLIHVGAILTIAGYSINDTIIVFDRIRESLLTTSGKVENLMNQAINATLSRTLLTSTTTITTVAILAIFGGASLREFSTMILVGLVIGTYSSIFVASPVVLLSSKGKNLRRQVLDASLAGDTAANA
ncbi:protein translocase subunit SecD [Haloferula rosea]|uniref:Multifunctional fusion protein n=1 Tax=Haloferula rosea TaxID=490093 RepID=A0A934RGM9_9BACT|nr:protein translocase subunit SecD [Haloferula rosea]MBK1828819.1 protein translocase subunit SecD [Haloferula rosea]